MFIVIEGVDGSGKKTQTELLARKLADMQYAVDTISFPVYDHWSSTFVQKLLHGEFWPPHTIDPYISSCMYILDRFAQLPVLIKKLQVYDYVISDRYSTSNFIHRGAYYIQSGDEDGMRNFFSWLYDMEFTRAQLPIPDKIFFLRLSIKSIELNLQRKASEKQRAYLIPSAELLDAAEKDLEHQKMALLVGSEVLPNYFPQYYVIDCEDSRGNLLPPQVINQKILAHIL